MEGGEGEGMGVGVGLGGGRPWRRRYRGVKVHMGKVF